jgi:plastocyanin
VGGGATIALDSTEISIDGTAHEIHLSGTGAIDSIAPATIQAESGDALVFVVDDRRPHAPTFTVESLSAPVRDYLERTGQLRGPPLVNEGSTWVVLLEDAPPGRYPFHCRSHDAAGVVVVAGDPDGG